MTLNPARFDFTGDQTIPQGTDWVKPFRILTTPDPIIPFVASVAYVEGDYIRPSAGSNGFIYRVIDTSGGNAGTEPTWATVKGGRNNSGGIITIAIPEGDKQLIDTDNYTARMKVRATATSSTVLFDVSTANGRMFTGFSPAKWTASTGYNPPDLVVPRKARNGWVYQCVNGGTSDVAEPAGLTPWPTTLGATVTDGGIEWKCYDTDDEVSNLRIAVTDAYTSALTEFGNAVYDIELIDSFGEVQRILEGAIWLSREVSR